MDEMNRRDTEYTNEENQEIKQEEYRFVREVIKEKSFDFRGLIFRGIMMLVGAVIFGVVAALVFVHILPMVSGVPMQEEKIVFKEDDSELNYEPTLTPMQTNIDEESSAASGEMNGNSVNETSADAGQNGTQDGTQDGTQAYDSQSGGSSDGNVMENCEVSHAELNQVAQDAMHSVVSVAGIRSNEDWFRLDSESVQQSTGLIIASNEQEYYILTEYSVVDSVDRIMLTFNDGSMADGRYQMHDANTGLTILTVVAADLSEECKTEIQVATLGNSYLVQQGEAVVAIGSPMGYSNSIVHGQVTSVSSTVSAYDVQYNVFITDILGSADGSGFLINERGNIIGIIAQGFSDEEHKNVITGLPISQLKALISILSNNGNLPYLGIKGQNVTVEISKQTGMPKGVYVNELHTDSPALQSGIQVADIIIELNGKTIESMHQYSQGLAKLAPGEAADITIMRKGFEGYVEFKFQVMVGNR